MHDGAADGEAVERPPERTAEVGQGAELARMEDRLKRALADLENYRKRSGREVERRVAEATEALTRAWLEVVDSVDRALRMQPDGPARGGLQSVLDQADSVLARFGVRRFGAPGERFDPTRHEAVDVRSAPDVDDQTIVEVVRSGYEIGDRVLRPAQVVVARRVDPQA
jgi:molecular chaperone GrpE